MPKLADFARRAVEMPAMPEVAQRLIRSFSREDLSLNAVAELVGKDPSLSAKLLRMANSARFSPNHQVSTLKDASMVLGLSNLRDLTLSSCLSGAMPAPAGFDRIAHWRGCMATAQCAQALAQALAEDTDVAYIAGLMLRSGRLLMAMVDLHTCHEVDLHATTPDSRMGWEQTLMGCSHPQVSAALASHWQFPAQLAQAFHAAAEPLEARPFSRLGAVLRLASVAADLREHGADLVAGLAELQGPLAQHMGLDLAWMAQHVPSQQTLSEGAQALLQ